MVELEIWSFLLEKNVMEKRIAKGALAVSAHAGRGLMGWGGRATAAKVAGPQRGSGTAWRLPRRGRSFCPLPWSGGRSRGIRWRAQREAAGTSPKHTGTIQFCGTGSIKHALSLTLKAVPRGGRGHGGRRRCSAGGRGPSPGPPSTDRPGARKCVCDPAGPGTLKPSDGLLGCGRRPVTVLPVKKEKAGHWRRDTALS